VTEAAFPKAADGRPGGEIRLKDATGRVLMARVGTLAQLVEAAGKLRERLEALP